MALKTIIYRISFKNVEGGNYNIEITDTASIPFEGADVEYIDLVGGETPLRLSTINNADDIYQTIFGTKATMTFKNTDEVNMATFSSGQNNRFSVWIGALGFRGYLLMDENSEPYLPPGQEVTLVATDNLGALKDIELSDATGERMQGEFSIITFVFNCLLKTNLTHNGTWSINVVNNLYEDSHADRGANLKNCPWEQTYLDAFMWGKGQGEFYDCNTVLDEILFSWGMRLFQYMGAWWVIRLDEYKEVYQPNIITPSGMFYTRYVNGVSVDGHEVPMEKTIDTDRSYQGLPKDRHVFGEAPRVVAQRAYKSVKMDYRYDFPTELIRNIGFLRGERDTSVPGTFFYAYHIEDWTLKRGWPGSPIASDATAWTRRIYDPFMYLIEYWVQINYPSNFDVRPAYIESYPLGVCIGDKVEVSVDYRILGGVGGGVYHLMNLVLHGSDGSWWKLDCNADGTGQIWRNTSNWTIATNSGKVDVTFDTPEWTTFSLEPPKLPVSGDLYIWLNGLNTVTGTDDDFPIHYNNLQFTYKPYINGSYTKFLGESYKVSNPLDYTAKREEELKMADAPCMPYKGAMKTFDGTYHLTNAWNDWRLTGLYSLPIADNRFAWWQAMAMWNQYRLGRVIFQGNWKGIDSLTVEPVWLLHRINITTISQHNLNRKFIFLSMEMDVRRCTYSGVLAEIDYLPDPRNYTDTLEFKYLLNG